MKIFTIFVMLLSLSVCHPAHAFFATKTTTFEQILPLKIKPGDRYTAHIDFAKQFSSIHKICFEASFDKDLFDPNEVFMLGPFDSISYGWVNVFSKSLSTRKLCLSSKHRGVNLFLDGKQSFGIRVDKGTVMLKQLRVSIQGDVAYTKTFARNVISDHSGATVDVSGGPVSDAAGRRGLLSGVAF